MRNIALRITISVLLVCFCQILSANVCSRIIHGAIGFSDRRVWSPDQIGNVKFMSFNIANYAQKVGGFKRLSTTQFEPLPEKPMMEKPAWQREWILDILWEQQPHVVLAQEIESSGVEALMQSDVGERYHIFYMRGNDGRGIDILTMFDKRLPISIDYQSSKDDVFYDPVEGTQNRLHSRDLTVADVYFPFSRRPFMSVLNSHYKSKRDRPGDIESSIWRTSQYSGARRKILELQSRWGSGHHIIHGADFNTDVVESFEIDPLRNTLLDAFGIAHSRNPNLGPFVTHTYHPKGGDTHYAQMDTFFVSQSLSKSIVAASVIPYRLGNGKIMKIPDTFAERSKQPSDHRAVMIEIPFKDLIDKSQNDLH